MTGLFDRQIHSHVACRMNDVRALGGQRAVSGDPSRPKRGSVTSPRQAGYVRALAVFDRDPPEPAECLAALGQILRRFCAQQKRDWSFPVRQQERDQRAADGARSASDEVVFHRLQIDIEAIAAWPPQTARRRRHRCECKARRAPPRIGLRCWPAQLQVAVRSPPAIVRDCGGEQQRRLAGGRPGSAATACGTSRESPGKAVWVGLPGWLRRPPAAPPVTARRRRRPWRARPAAPASGGFRCCAGATRRPVERLEDLRFPADQA